MEVRPGWQLVTLSQLGRRTNTHGRWPLDLVVASATVAAASSQIFRYGTREHAAVSSETGDFCEVALVPRDRDRSRNLNLSGDLVVFHSEVMHDVGPEIVLSL
jgi:hypothetical protein